jgi:DNA-binding transcriptional LysR family regulator
MKKLEAELGSPLFFREANRLQLTAFGRQMTPLLEQISARTEAAAAAAENFRLLRQQPVRLGVMPTLGPLRIAQFLSDFERTHPGVEVAVSEGRTAELGAGLEADSLDVAILNPFDSVADGFRIEQLYVERYVVILPPGHALKESNAVSLPDLAGLPYVDRLACEMREMVMQVCGARGVSLYARFRSEREDWVLP